jgi:hypothetical protein
MSRLDRDYHYDTLVLNRVLEVPVKRDVAVNTNNVSVNKGSVVYNEEDDLLYVGDGITLNPVGGGSPGVTYTPFTPVFGTHINFTVSEVVNAQFAHYGTGSGSYVHFTMALEGFIGAAGNVRILFGLPTPGAPHVPDNLGFVALGAVSVVLIDGDTLFNGTVYTSATGSPLRAGFTSTTSEEGVVHIDGSYTLA